MILGHEVSGHITALGAGVSGLSVGQLVAVSPSRPCGNCRFCNEGRHNQCLNMRFIRQRHALPAYPGGVPPGSRGRCIPMRTRRRFELR